MSVENPEVTAIILAGGKSQRMGSNKALLKYGDTTFIERQIARLSKIFHEIILSANDASIYAHLPLPVVPDVIPGKGPLGGICAGIMRATNYYPGTPARVLFQKLHHTHAAVPQRGAIKGHRLFFRSKGKDCQRGRTQGDRPFHSTSPQPEHTGRI
ncbi:MAG: molybdenum cofactor guanylyltransferase [Planctomycetes bacterium]|nr:molybdenum cofactor guanylyltransferase [Planctomycetota bacterium]